MYLIEPSAKRLYDTQVIKSPEIIAETNEYVVINKPAGYAVEPVGSYPAVVDWFSHRSRNPDVEAVHRLDVETSGVLILAKDSSAKENLQRLWQGRSVKKTYLALTVGATPTRGEIELPIIRDTKKDRMKAVILATGQGRAALTRYRRIKLAKWQQHTVSLVEAHPVTGRTHQIRVHLKAIGHPIIGDRFYQDKEAKLIADKLSLHRHFLHSYRLELEPGVRYEAKLPSDLSDALTTLGTGDIDSSIGSS